MTNTDLMNVNAFKGIAPAAAFGSLNAQDESLADGIGSSYGIIGYKGKVWTLRHRGETHTFTRPDDGSPAPFLDVIVLRSAGYKSKSYYPAGTFDDRAAAGTRPTCSALDGLTPDADAQEKQATHCAICPRNVFQVNAEGRKSRECSDYKRLAVLLLPNVSKRLLGSPLMEPVFLRVPAASLNDLAQLGEAMGGQGFHYSSYITRIGFEPTKPHPQMTFRALQALTDKEAPVVIPMREEAQAFRITGENEVGKPKAVAGPASQAQQPTNVNNAQTAQSTRPPQTSATTTSPSRTTAKPETVDTGFGGDEGGTVAQNNAGAGITIEGTATVVDKSPAPPAGDVVEAGFDTEIDQEPTQLAQSGPLAPAEEDTGAPEEADMDLDARVAGLLQR